MTAEKHYRPNLSVGHAQIVLRIVIYFRIPSLVCTDFRCVQSSDVICHGSVPRWLNVTHSHGHHARLFPGSSANERTPEQETGYIQASYPTRCRRHFRLGWLCSFKGEYIPTVKIGKSSETYFHLRSGPQAAPFLLYTGRRETYCVRIPQTCEGEAFAWKNVVQHRTEFRRQGRRMYDKSPLQGFWDREFSRKRFSRPRNIILPMMAKVHARELVRAKLLWSRFEVAAFLLSGLQWYFPHGWAMLMRRMQKDFVIILVYKRYTNKKICPRR